MYVKFTPVRQLSAQHCYIEFHFKKTRQKMQQLMSGQRVASGFAGGRGNHRSFCIRFLLLRKQPVKCEIEKAFNGVTFVKTFWFRTWHGQCTHAHTHRHYEAITSLYLLTSKSWLKLQSCPQAFLHQLIRNSRPLCKPRCR
jgi:hypothetical protein